ncbi:DegT/DnrJ/EryC1/StrS family aminotransferase [Patescibacteria group bacterium]|nr:DegT/DnrJ/EryC1/StrS family aminotransferase [Patescibacteria group bacterium]MBU1499832.1 DegT/DnrJ/EryC1/StrS family aminotransferase [Patescibacteria group bacterium]
MKRISVYKLDSAYKSKVFGSGKWVDGELLRQLEGKLKKYLNVKYVVLTNNGTAALLAAYWVLKDQFSSLNVDPYTFPATYQPAKLLGYQIKFNRNILIKNPKLSGNSLNTIVHLFGQANPLLTKVGNKPFIEDACQAFGAEFRGKKAGTFGIMGCYSFYPTKSLHTCGHGGAVVTKDKKLFQKLKVFIESGRINGQMTDNVALNLRMDEIKAEYLLKEMATYEKRVRQQKNLAKEFLEIIPSPQPFLEETKNTRHIYSVFNMLIRNRDNFRKYMDKAAIETIAYYGNDILPQSERYKYKDLTGSVVAIPCRWNLIEQEKHRIKSALKGWFL